MDGPREGKAGDLGRVDKDPDKQGKEAGEKNSVGENIQVGPATWVTGRKEFNSMVVRTVKK